MQCDITLSNSCHTHFFPLFQDQFVNEWGNAMEKNSSNNNNSSECNRIKLIAPKKPIVQ